MSEHHTNGTGVIGAIFGFLSYIVASGFKLLPDAGHFIPAIITAASCTALGFIVTKFMGWCWMKAGYVATRISINISSKKKGFFSFLNKKK